MYSEDDIDDAVRAGVIDAGAAAAFRAHVAVLRAVPAVDEEHFRLVTGFNDFFVVIAAALLLAAVVWIGAAATDALGAGLAAVVAWGLAEFFVRRRRMALPGIFLLLAFVLACASLAHASLPASPAHWSLIFAAGSCAALAHWWRFQVPITVAAGCAAASGAIIVGAMTAMPLPQAHIAALVLAAVCGLAVFVLAMRWDASDRTRETRRSDIAFWLHLLAAPLLVHPVVSLLGVLDGTADRGAWLAMIALYAVVGVVSLATDRRALLVSALGYVLYAFNSILKTYGVVSLSFALTALLIGSALLLLSVFWHPIRRWALRCLPGALLRYLPPAVA